MTQLRVSGAVASPLLCLAALLRVHSLFSKQAWRVGACFAHCICKCLWRPGSWSWHAGCTALQGVCVSLPDEGLHHCDQPSASKAAAGQAGTPKRTTLSSGLRSNNRAGQPAAQLLGVCDYLQAAACWDCSLGALSASSLQQAWVAKASPLLGQTLVAYCCYLQPSTPQLKQLKDMSTSSQGPCSGSPYT